MKRLGGLFSALGIAAVLCGLWLIWAPQLAPVPVPDPVSRPGTAPVQPARPAAITSAVQRILVEKGARRMTVWQREGPPLTFRIALGFAPDGDKSREGDGRTPEGLFRIDRLNRHSKYHLSLGIDYPQPRHRAAARRAGVSPGGDIMIHGQPNELPDGFKVKGDWTAGCIAITNDEVAQIFAHAAIGTEVEIRP